MGPNSLMVVYVDPLRFIGIAGNRRHRVYGKTG